MRERNDGRYETLEILPETIEQELRPVECEQRQTDLTQQQIFDKTTCENQLQSDQMQSIIIAMHGDTSMGPINVVTKLTFSQLNSRPKR